MEQDFFPDEGDHAVAAAEGDGADLKKGEEQLQEHITSPPFCGPKATRLRLLHR